MLKYDVLFIYVGGTIGAFVLVIIYLCVLIGYNIAARRVNLTRLTTTRAGHTINTEQRTTTNTGQSAREKVYGL